MRTRNWSIRSKIIALVVVPLSALLALWIFATVLTAGPAVNLLSARTLLDTVGNPGEVLVGELQRERRASVVYLSDVHATTDALTAQRAATDRAAADFRSAASSNEAQDAASPALRSRISQILLDLNALPGNRKYVDIRRIDPVGAQGNFNNIIDTGFQMFAATATFGDEQIDRQIRALSAVGRGQEYLSRVDSLLAGANAAGKFDSAGRRELLEAVGTSQFLFTDGVNDLPSVERTNFQAFNTGTAFSRLRQLQDTLVTTSRAGAASPVTAEQWQPAYDQSAQQLRAFEVNGATALADRATPVAVNVLVRLGAAGLLGLIALIVSLFVSIRVGRSLVGRLRRLRAEALEMAGERLPAVVRRLQRGEAVDVDVETPPLEYGRDEIGQVGRAFTAVQRTAVQSAVEEASVRRGINEVFLNIARRSQTLLHRQLALLDKMERRETEPDELEDLYRVDHLATRMRRHAEDLVILAGAAPGRGWRNPVPVIDVVRGAISEVEDYKRVDIVSVESSAVLGRAVGDVIHLLAELLENAASFSPPQTRVQVVGQVLPNGYALEIEDRGLGMSPEALAEANRKLLEPPDFDPADSARLGLFVVAQLADRHGIRVSLRPSGYGGVTAVVLIPGELVTTGQGQAALPAGPTPPDTSWDRPLVGPGTEDPARSSLGALQWQGTEQVRSIAMTGRPVTINGTATAGPELTDETARPGPDRREPATATGSDVGDPTRPLSRHTLGLSDTPVAEPVEPAGTLGGPAPSAVVDGLTEDGLVQRRRTKPRRGSGERAAPPALLPPNLTSPAGLSSAPRSVAPGSAAPGSAAPGSAAPVTPARPASLSSDFPSAGNGRTTTNGSGLTGAGLNVPGVGGSALDGPGLDGPGLNGPGPDGLNLDGPLRHGEGPAMLGTPTPVPPRIPSPRVAPEAMPGAPKAVPQVAPKAMPKDAPTDEPSGDEADERLLPRRVRQASLAPQLRGPVAEQTAAPSRSPEQVRSLMSALQQGTTRGRREAAGLSAANAAAAAGGSPDDRATNGPETDKQQTVGEPMWSEAATVIFPAVQDPVAAGSDNSTDNAPENHENRPDKDA
jgi:signal transduction histidine kinase